MKFPISHRPRFLGSEAYTIWEGGRTENCKCKTRYKINIYLEWEKSHNILLETWRFRSLCFTMIRTAYIGNALPVLCDPQGRCQDSQSWWKADTLDLTQLTYSIIPLSYSHCKSESLLTQVDNKKEPFVHHSEMYITWTVRDPKAPTFPE